MHRVIYFGIFTFTFIFASKIASEPVELKPLMVIDCGNDNRIFKDSCYKWIEFATNKLSQSGQFKNILSISNNSFLYRSGEMVYPTTFSEQYSYKKYWIQKYFLQAYASEASLLTDPKLRYAYILSNRTDNIENCSECLEVKDTLKHSRINSWFINEKEFIYAERNNLNGPVTIEVVLTPDYLISDIKTFYLINSLQKSLYSVPGVKLVYSPVNIYSFLNTAVRLTGNTAQNRWESAISMWDLAGERRSAYLDLNRNILYVDIYGVKFSNNLLQNIKKVIMTLDKKTENWKIHYNQEIIFSKIDDNKKNNQTLTNKEENNENFKTQ